MSVTAPGLRCASCQAVLLRCWVCNSIGRCTGCQQCQKCEGLFDAPAPGTVRESNAPFRVPSVRLKRTARDSRSSTENRPVAPKRLRATRVVTTVEKAAPRPYSIESFFWYVLVAIVPTTMLAAAFALQNVLPFVGGFRFVVAYFVGFYVPYVILTPIRVPNQFFPMKEGGAELPFLMAFVGAIAGLVVGFVVLVLSSLDVAIQVGVVAAVIAFHLAYYNAIQENCRLKK